MIGKFITILLSCGQIEEGILEDWAEIDPTDNSIYAVISIKGNPSKKLRVKKFYIAAHQIDEDVIIDKKPIIVEDALVNVVKNKFNIQNVIKAKKNAEQEVVDEHYKKQEVSREYAESIYAQPSSMLKKK